MTIHEALIIIFGVLAAGAAFYAVITRYLIRSIMAFGAFLTAVAGEFYLLAADFVAVIQIFVYIGGIVVLILFALMLSSTGQRHPVALAEKTALGAILAYGLGAWVIFAAVQQAFPDPAQVPENSVPHLGRAFLNEQLYPFELIAVILLAAVITALAIVRGERQ